jgi:hypothetical protein
MAASTIKPEKLVEALRRNALFRHQATLPLSAEKQARLNGDLMWVAADEIERLRSIIAQGGDSDETQVQSAARHKLTKRKRSI